jgi:lysophospholipase L1-like esterase
MKVTKLFLIGVVAAITSVSTAAAQNTHWVGTWSASEVGRPQSPGAAAGPPPAIQGTTCPAVPVQSSFIHFNNQTLRQIVHTSVGGSRLRVVLSNAYGTAPLTIGAAHVALREQGASIQKASGRTLTFSGRPSITIPEGALMYSDPLDLSLPPLTDLAIDLYLPGNTDTPALLTFHTNAFQTNYVSETGNHSGSAKFSTIATAENWFLLYRVEVEAPASVGGLVAFGDSITDGTRSTPDSNNRWPDQLARRIFAPASPLRIGIMNAGLGGNRLLSEGTFNQGMNALSRFEHNALSQPGVTHIVIMEGINDIGNARTNANPSAEDIIAAYKQLIARAHTHDIKIYGATLLPFYGAFYYTDVGEAKRQAVNQWIRSSKAFDAVVDLDLVVRDPGDPKKYRPAYEACDHLHPNDAGYKAIADSIDLAIFTTRK